MDNQMLLRKLGSKPIECSGLVDIANNRDFQKNCLVCNSVNVKDLNWNDDSPDWVCLTCGTAQLNHLKQLGFRYYAFLLKGSWTSKYFYARNKQEAYRLAVKTYGDFVTKSYMVGVVDGFCLSNWLSF